MIPFKKVLVAGILLFTLVALFSCAETPPPSTTEAETLPETEQAPPELAPEYALPKPDEHTFQALGSDKIDLLFPCSSHDLLSTQTGKNAADFEAACATYEKMGYTLYSSLELGSTLARTYTKNQALAHLYYHEATGELNAVVSDNLGANLPPATPKDTSGDYECTVTQLNQVKHGSGGMGYVIRLKDGSFIIYDGGLASSADEILEILREACPDEKPLVRAWLITHLHNDHYTAFHEMAKRMRTEELLTLEYVIASPIVEGYRDHLRVFSADVFSFPGARFIFAHTGMRLQFCNLTMEILYTPESLYKNRETENFNNTSILSRLKDENTSMLFTGDLALEGATLCEVLYGNALASDWCQMSHHGLEDCPLSFYEKVKASVYWVPTTPQVYGEERNLDLRRAVEALPTTKEILIAGSQRYVRPLQSQ